MRVAFDIFAAADPNGARLASFVGTNEVDSKRAFRKALNDPGSGGFEVNRHVALASTSILASGNVVKVRLLDYASLGYVHAFILEKDDATLLAADEEGGEKVQCGGRGILAYLSRAIMWDQAFTTGLDISDTWTEIWSTTAVPFPVGTAFLAATPGYVYVIGQRSRRIYKVDQTTHKVVAYSPILWSGSSNWAGGLSADPADANVMWALETPWVAGGSGNTKIRKIDITGSIGTWNVAATHDLGSAAKLTAIKANSANLWTSRYDGTATIQKRSKTTGALTTAYTIAYGGVTQTKATGISVNGTNLAYWFSGTKRALIAAASAPTVITDKISTQAIVSFGGDWTTESSQDYFYMDSYTSGRVWKYQLTAASPHDPLNGVWRLDEPTPGAILWRIILEAQAAGRPQQPIPDVTYDFTSTLDSNGAAWATHDGTKEFDARVGDDVMDTSVRLIPYGLTIQMQPDLELVGRNTSAYGTDRSATIRFVDGVNIIPEVPAASRERTIHSHMLAAGQSNRYATATDDDLGYVREGFISTDLQSVTALTGTAQATLDQERVDAVKVAIRVPIGDDADAGLWIPFRDYDVGDTIYVETGDEDRDVARNLVVYAISPEEGEAGDFATAVLELESRLSGSLSPVEGGTSSSTGGGTSTSSGGGSTTITTNPLTVTDGADVSIPEVTTIQAEGAYSPTPGTAVIPSGATDPPLAEDLLTDETDTTTRLAPDGAGGVEFRQVDVDELTTSEIDTTLVAAPDGAGGLVFRSGITGVSFPWVNAADYGVVGDDTTDDAAALQAAFDATPAQETLFIPFDNCKIIGAVTRDAADGPINIIGAGSKHGGTIIRQASPNTNGLVINVDVLSAYSPSSIDNNRNYDIASSMRHLRVIGPTGSTDAHAGAGIYALSDLILEDVSTYGFNAGAFIDWRSYYGRAVGCKFAAATTYGLIHKGYNWTADDCQFWNSGYGAWISGFQNMRFIGCVWEQNSIAGLYADGALQGSLTQPASTLLVDGGYFEETAVGVPDIVIGATTVVTGVIIQAAHFQANAQGDTGASWHVDLYKATGVTIEGNRLYGSGIGGGDIRASADTVGVVLVNQFDAITSGLPADTVYLDKDHRPLSGGTPALTLGTANSAGTATSGVRTDATIAAFDATAPAAVGTAATGSAGKAARRDHVHATGAGTPTTSAIGDAAAAGAGPAAAMTDHVHGREALSSATPLVEAGTGAVGTATKNSREDHVHPAATVATGADDHIHVVGERFVSDGAAVAYILANEAIPSTVAATLAGLRKAVTLAGMNDVVTLPAAGSAGDEILVDYIPRQA